MKCLSGPASAGTLFLEAEKRWGFYFAAVILTVSRCRIRSAFYKAAF